MILNAAIILCAVWAILDAVRGYLERAKEENYDAALFQDAEWTTEEEEEP